MKLRLTLLVFMLLAAPEAGARKLRAQKIPLKRYTIKRPECLVKVKETAHAPWQTLKEPLEMGQTVIGKPSSKDPSIIFFKNYSSDTAIYATRGACLFGGASPQAPQPTPTAQTAPLPESRDRTAPEPSVTADIEGRPIGEWLQNWFVSIGFFSWQEKLFLDGQFPTEITETSLGGCFGGGWELRHGIFDFGLSGCGFFAESEAGATSPVSYRLKNAKVFGGMIGPGGFVHPFDSRSISIGLSIPVIIRKGDWPTVPSYSISPTFSINVTPLLESRIAWDDWFVSQKIGFYRSFSSVVWMLQLSKGFVVGY